MEETDVNEQGSATQPAEPVTPVDNNTAPETAEFNVPDEYKEAGWASNIKSVNDLWTQHANAQKLIGKKTIGIPTADSSEAEIEEFYGKVRPENQDGYEIDLGDDTALFKDIFYKNGISARQGKAIVEAYKESVRNASEGLYSEEGLKQAMRESLGDDYKAKMDKVNGFLKQHGKKSALQEIDQLPNETLGLLYSLIDMTMDKYGVKELGSVEQKPAYSSEENMAKYMEEMTALHQDPFINQDKINAVKRKYGIIK